MRSSEVSAGSKLCHLHRHNVLVHSSGTTSEAALQANVKLMKHASSVVRCYTVHFAGQTLRAAGYI